MELETEIANGVARVHIHASPEEAALYVLALGAMQNGHGVADGAARAPVRGEEVEEGPRLFALAGVESAEPTPAEPIGVRLLFRVPGAIVTHLTEAGHDLHALGPVDVRHMSGGDSWSVALTHDSAVTLYEWLEELLAAGHGKNNTNIYTTKRKLTDHLDRHFKIGAK
jgi:hypothetical protein